MPKLRANPSLTGGQIRLRASGRASELKWLGVLAILVAATAIEGGLPVQDFGRAAIEFASRGGSTVAVASPARAVGPGIERIETASVNTRAGLLTEVSSGDSGALSDIDTSDFEVASLDNPKLETASFVAHNNSSTAGLFGRTQQKAMFCPWSRPRSNS